MQGLFADVTRHRRIRAEMKALHVGLRLPVPEFLLALLAATGIASALSTLIRL